MYGMKQTLADPPRQVPALVRARVLFGGLLSQFGWLFVGVGMIFVWVFTARSDLTSWYRFRGDVRQVPGEVLGSDETGFSVGSGGRGHHRRGASIYAIHYKFTPPGGVERKGVSYATGWEAKHGEKVTVEFPASDPATSRIEGTRRGVLGPVGALALVFPLVGLVIVAIGLRKGRKGVRLLRDGKQAMGKLIAREPTPIRVNRQIVYKFTFEFTAEDGQTYQATARTHEESKFAGEQPEDEDAGDEPEGDEDEQPEVVEPLLYDPVDPARSALLDGLPGSPRIAEDGRILIANANRALLVLALPAASVLGHGAYALSLLR